MAMETALLNCSVEEVIQLLKGLLKKQGYEIKAIDLDETIVLAYRDGKWFSQKQTVLFEISTLDDAHTRVDVTAMIEGNEKSKEAEEVLEEKMVTSLYQFRA